MIPSDPESYWCFISYRHADNRAQDREWASWLHREIERYEVPAELVGTKNARGDTIPERIYPVFRDEESLPADADLANTIVNALDRSRFLVVLCSPRARESTYVAQEILHFKRSGHEDRIIAAILDGEPGDPETDCFPEPLRHPLDSEGGLDGSKEIEPIAADFRLRDGSEGFTSAEGYRLALSREGKLRSRQIRERAESYDGQLQLMKLKIIAGILGIPLERLRDRDKAYRLELARRRAALLRRWLAALVILLILACGAGMLAWNMRNRAVDARNEQRESSARSLFRLALESHRDDRKRDAAAFLARALRTDPHHRQAQRFAAQILPELLEQLPASVESLDAADQEDWPTIGAAVGDGYDRSEGITLSNPSAVVKVQRQGSSVTFPLVGRKGTAELPFPHEGLVYAALSPSGTRIALTGQDFRPDDNTYLRTTHIYDTRTGNRLCEPKPGRIGCFAAGEELFVTVRMVSGENVLESRRRAELDVWDTRSGERRKGVVALPDPLFVGYDPAAGQIVCRVSDGDREHRLCWPVRSCREFEVPVTLADGQTSLGSLALSVRGEWAAAVVGDNRAAIIHVPSRAVRSRRPLSGEFPVIALSADGSELYEETENEVITHHLAKGTETSRPGSLQTREIPPGLPGQEVAGGEIVAWNDRGDRLFVGEGTGRIGILDRGTWRILDIREGTTRIDPWWEEYGQPMDFRAVFSPDPNDRRAGVSMTRFLRGARSMEQCYIVDSDTGIVRAHLANIEGHGESASSFSSDLSQLIIASGSRISFIDTSTGLQWLDDWRMLDGQDISGFQASDDGAVLLVATYDDRVHFKEFRRYQHDLPGEIPAILEQTSGRFVDENAIVRELTRQPVDAWWKELQALVERCGQSYPEVGWALDTSPDRTVTPYATLTLRQFAEEQLTRAHLTATLRAHRALPEDGLVRIALGLEEIPGDQRSEFLIRSGLSLLWNDLAGIRKAYSLLSAYEAVAFLPLALERMGQLDPSVAESYRQDPAAAMAQLPGFAMNRGTRPGAATTRTFVNQGLRYAVTVSLTIRGQDVTGTIVSNEHGSDPTGALAFNGTTNGRMIRVKVEAGDLDGVVLKGADGDGFHSWRHEVRDDSEVLHVLLESRSGTSEWPLQRQP